MAGKKVGGENTKKAAGNARKAEAAAQKQAVEEAKKTKVEDEQWSKGSKSTAKKDAAEAKKADVARKKAEKDALLAAEEKTLKAAKNSVSKTASSKKPNNKTSSGGTLDLTQLDTDDDIKQAPLNASGIDNALDALSLTTTTATNNNNSGQQIDRHPERRYKAAYAAYEARRLPELEEEFKGLRRAQRIELVKKEFEKAPENPFNMVSVRFDASREEVREVRERERRAVEERLTRGGGAGGG